jgi:hypothetical protein
MNYFNFKERGGRAVKEVTPGQTKSMGKEYGRK